jgi:acetyl-CoA carboxylase carboxyltransferase component
MHLGRSGLDPFADGLPERCLGPWERLTLLCDVGTLEPIRSQAGAGDRVPGDGVVSGTGLVEGRRVVCYAQDRSVAGGSLGTVGAETIVRALRIAGAAQAPVVSFVESAGARLQEGGRALAGYGRVFRETVALSGRVPQISVITGVAAGGGSYAPALTDFVVMTGDASMFLTGPSIVRRACGEEVTARELGGPRMHGRNGVCHMKVPSDVDAVFLTRELLSYLPERASRPPARVAARPAPPGNPGDRVPASPRSVYDVRAVVRAIADDGRMLEVAPRWARNMVTGFARIDGWAVGIVANQPRYLGGVIDSLAAQKAAGFVRTCDGFGLPLVVLVDTPGFMPGIRQEAHGIIRHGATLLHAFAAASVPRVTIVLRKAYGGAYISMNSKDLGADLALAWPGAEIGIMAASQAVGIVHRRELDSATDPDAARAALATEYANEHLAAATAAADGLVDEIIEPAQTRARLVNALGLLCRTADRRGAGREIGP